MDKLKKLLTQLLLAFVLVSIGFLFGKNSVEQAVPETVQISNEDHAVMVYYLHTTFRCTTCNTIEQMAKDLVDHKYRIELASGKLYWQTANFQENENLAKRFNISASCVVVSEMKDGKIVKYSRLDEVWTLMKNPEAFDKYISKTIDEYLKNAEDKS